MLSRLLTALLLASAACGDNAIPPAEDPPDGGGPPPDSGVPRDRGHSGGSPSALAISGTRAYIGVGPRLVIWDVAPARPTVLGETAPLPGVIRAVAVAGSRAYVAESTGATSTIHVVDVTAPAAPVETAAFAVAALGEPSVILDLVASATRLYVADHEQGVVELDLADPDAPATLRTVPMLGVRELSLAFPRLYYSHGGLLGEVVAGALALNDDLADLGASSLGGAEGIAFTGRMAITAGPAGVSVFDVAVPSKAVQRFHYSEILGGPFARAIATNRTTAWVPADNGLHVLDLSTPTFVIHSGPLDLETANVNATAATADVLAIVTDRGRLLALDVTNPTDPAHARTTDVSLCASCVGVKALGETVYVADSVGGLRTASLPDLAPLGRAPGLPPLPGRGGLQLVLSDLEVAGTRAYAADWLFGLRIYDVSDPRRPALLGSLATGGAPSSVTVEGARAYVAEGSSGGALRVIDVADPAHPVQLGAARTTKAMKVVVRGSIAYVADEALGDTGGLRILDVSNPGAITELGVYDTDCSSAGDVAVVGTVAVVACQSDGFHWVDVSNPAAPIRLRAQRLAPGQGTAQAVAAWQGYAALGHARGVVVVDDAGTTVAAYETAFPVRALDVTADGRILAACGLGGLYQWKPPR